MDAPFFFRIEGTPLLEAIQIFDLIEGLAPKELAESWDNVGLMVGTGKTRVNKILLALDPTISAIQAAHEAGAQLLLTHHPLIFHPLNKIDLTEPTAAAAALAIKLGITVYSAHTNLDAAPDGVSWALARRLDLQDVALLSPGPDSSSHTKLVVFVPIGYEKAVRDALFLAGAGRIGAYNGCSFSMRGQGTFTPLENATPFIGQRGQSERVAESRLEVLVDNRNLEGTVQALLEAHPYEEVAYDLYPLVDPVISTGIGCIGQLNNEHNIDELVEIVKEKLEINRLRVAAGVDGPLQVAAVVGGSGGGYVAQARARGAQVMISGDFSYHQAREAESLGICLIDAGHYATEKPILFELASRLSKLLETEDINIEFKVFAGDRDPWQEYKGV